MSHTDAVDPNHAMQLHASHSTPSLESIAVTEYSSRDVAGSSRHADVARSSRCDGGPSVSSQQESGGSKGFAASKIEHLGPEIDICANAAEIGFAPVATLPHSESDQPNSNLHYVTSPSFPIIVTGTPNTPSLIPTDPLPHQGSHTLFSPHQPTQGPEPPTQRTEASQSLGSRLSRASLSGPEDIMEADDKQAPVDLAGRALSLSGQMSRRSVSLGSPLTNICFSKAPTLHHFLPCLQCMLALLALQLCCRQTNKPYR